MAYQQIWSLEWRCKNNRYITIFAKTLWIFLKFFVPDSFFTFRSAGKKALRGQIFFSPSPIGGSRTPFSLGLRKTGHAGWVYRTKYRVSLHAMQKEAVNVLRPYRMILGTGGCIWGPARYSLSTSLLDGAVIICKLSIIFMGFRSFKMFFL